MRLIAGAMSGTSADGVDIAITQIDGRGLAMSAQLIHHHAEPYPSELRQAIQRIRSEGRAELSELAAVGRQISGIYADAVLAACDSAGVRSQDLACVAAHGQTLFHAPPDTIQWLDPALIASRTHCPVVSDFRRADCAAGGQGAPLVPFADYILFRHPTRSRVLLNIGGIANLTWLPAGASIDDVIAFDTGPGNCMSDWICREYVREGPGYDAGGEKALADAPVPEVFQWLMEQPYFRQPPPKSTDGPSMLRLWQSVPLALRPHLGHGIESEPRFVERSLATAALWTGESIQRAMLQWLPAAPHEVIISGGGAENAAIMRYLYGVGIKIADHEKPPTRYLRMEELGIPAMAKEALAFALLGAATLDNEPSNVPAATGAARRVVLGSITPRP